MRIYFQVGNSYASAHSEFNPDSWTAIIDYSLIYMLTFFAFIQNMAREIIKDAQDVEGDKLIYVKSLPMILGQQKSLMLVALTKMNSFIGTVQFWTATIPFGIAALINLVVIFLIFTNKTKQLKLYDALIKISMLIGVLATFYIGYLHL